MAAAPKLSAEQWAAARSVWEADPRVGFAWLPEQLSLPVSRESCRKKAEKEGWKKRPELFASRANSGSSAMVAPMVATAGSGNLPTTLEQISANEAKPFKTRETPVLDQLDEDLPQQGVFAREYCKDLNATQAAIRAGYSVQTAGQQAHELLKKPEIQAAVRELRDETLRKLEANVEELVRYWLDILRADPNEITSYRRPACPYCHGELKDDGYKRHRQYTPAKFGALSIFPHWGMTSVVTPSSVQQMLVINESGLYSLTLTSRKPEAKRFKKWVTGEVLPSIRKTGAIEVFPHLGEYLVL